VDYAKRVERTNALQSNLRRFRAIGSLGIAILFTFVGASVAWAEMVAVLTVASVVPGPRAFGYVIRQARDKAGSDERKGAPRSRMSIPVMPSGLVLSILVVIVVAWRWGAWPAAALSLTVYATEYLIARELCNRGRW
jgi:uncharacterized membrane protein